MKIPKSWHKVTPLSKILALILFILLPFIGFYLGFVFRGKLDEAMSFNKYMEWKADYNDQFNLRLH